MKSSVGDAFDDKVVKGATGGVVAGGGRVTGGGGGRLDGNTPKGTSVPLFQSSSKVTLEPDSEPGGLFGKSEPADFDFPFTPKSSSSSKVTHPFGLLIFAVD